MDIKPCTVEYEQYLIKLANDNLCRGVIEEPRLFFDEITVPADGTMLLPGTINYSSADVFKNGERFPVRITHVTFSTSQYGVQSGDAVQVDPIEIQRVGVQMRFHDQWYMNPLFPAVPTWATQPCSSPFNVSQSTAAWKFERPFILSARDTLEVKVALLTTPEAGQPVTVTFTGVGLKSKRPYFLTGQKALVDTSIQNIPSNNYRNDGAEPILITDMTANLAGAIGSNVAQGDIRGLRMQVRCIGNGTNSNWFITPTVPTPLFGGIAASAAVYSGRSIVHRFPGDGLLWEPGEGIDIAIRRLSADTPLTTWKLLVGLAGYIAVQ